MPYQPTIADLKAAFARARELHLRGWDFARAMAAPLVRLSLVNSARAHRARLEAQAGRRLPAQADFLEGLPC